MGDSSFDRDTVVPPKRELGDGEALCLVASVDGTLLTHRLPETGELTIGRAPDNALQIDHPSVSRHHARLRVGERVTIEDLGSANGVRLREQLLAPGEPATVSVGELVELGQVMLFLRRRMLSARPRRVWPHGYFEARIEEQCERAAVDVMPFAVARVDVEGVPPAGALDEAFVALRPLDLLAQYAPSRFELLLPDTPPAEAATVLEALRAKLEARGLRVRVGVAHHPGDGVTPEALLGRACDDVRGEESGDAGVDAAPGGGAMRLVHRLVEQVAGSDLAVLILGETGVGKEVIAEALHRASPRRDRKLVRLHCAALSESLLESELFGHEKGAFTGAQAAKPGLFEVAEGGTLLLDEIGELPPAMQVKLLRVLEDKQVLRVGAVEPRRIDVRFVAATNRDLEAEIAAGRFRGDLYYRLNGITLWIPPLRERRDEIEPLARQFVRDACKRLKRASEPLLLPEVLHKLRAYAWPGNVRELRNAIERAVVLCGDGPIRLEHLPTEKMGAPLLERPKPAAPAAALGQELDALERQRILDAVAECGGNQSRAARLLGISRNTLAARLDAYGVRRPRKP